MTNNLNNYRIRILCEDKAQLNFIRHILIEMGAVRGRISSPDLPEGTHSGEQFVKMRFEDEYKKHIRKSENLILVVVQDVDARKTVEDAKNDLIFAVRDIGISERVMYVLPKRNIETWFEWLHNPSSAVDESENYKNNHKKPRTKAFAKAAITLLNNSISEPSICNCAPDSLVFSSKELKRVLSQIK